MRRWLWSLAKVLLFRMDAEAAHRLTVALIRVGIGLGGVPLRIASGAPSPRRTPDALVRVFGLEFRSRVGLAAGFDKDASFVRGLPDLGFGFAEVGTVTPRPQPGNPFPRLFRDPSRQSLFNRMGFNGLGAELVSRRLAEQRERLPAGFRVGINVGKNKDTPLADAAVDYAAAIRAFRGLADYVVVNVSSPNTPGLRALQSVGALKPIIQAVREVISAWSVVPPLLLKLAPELEGERLNELIGALEPIGVQGWVLTNTLGGEFPLSGGREALAGGWSGGVLTESSRARLVQARSATRLPIISVGGIMDAAEAVKRIEFGADLVQIYSGWIFGGPGLPMRISRAIAKKT